MNDLEKRLNSIENEIKSHQKEIEKHRDEIRKLEKQRKDIRSKTSFERLIEGDVCNADIGDKVIILQGPYEGKTGIVSHKDVGTRFYGGRAKQFTFYEVSFPDGGVLTYHHTDLKKSR